MATENVVIAAAFSIISRLQNIRIGKNSERQRLDNDEIKQAARFGNHSGIRWTRKQLGNVVARLATG